MTRFICTGDLHLGQRPDLSEDRLLDQHQVWERILEAAAQEGAAVLFAGDAFEGPLATPEQIEAFIAPIEAHGVPVFAITGNGRHDSAMRDFTALSALRNTPYLTCTPRESMWTHGGVMIAGLSWASPKWLRARLLERGIAVDDSDIHAWLARALVGAAGEAREAGAHVLLTHFSMSGAELPTGLPVDQLHEPIANYADLEAQGWRAIVCGHIHRPQVLGTTGFYVGSPMPLNFGETGYQHGYWTLDVDPTGETPTLFEFHELVSRDLVIWDWNTGTECRASEGAVIRVDYTATEEDAQYVDQQKIRQSLIDQGAHRVFFKPTIIRAERARVEAITDQLSDESALRLWLESTSPPFDDMDTHLLLAVHRELAEGLT